MYLASAVAPQPAKQNHESLLPFPILLPECPMHVQCCMSHFYLIALCLYDFLINFFGSLFYRVAHFAAAALKRAHPASLTKIPVRGFRCKFG
jgi:hypothetical protein